MKSYKELAGQIVRAEVVKLNDSRTVEGIVVDYTYNPNTTINKRHKVEMINTRGETSIIFAKEGVTKFEVISIDKAVEDCLNKVREAILRRREAEKQVLAEKAIIEKLTSELLSTEDAIDRDTFIKKIESYSDDLNLNLKFYLYNQSHNKKVLTFESKGFYFGITTNKNYVTDIRISEASIIKEKIDIDESVGISPISNKLVFNHKEDEEKLARKFTFEPINSEEFLKYIELNEFLIDRYSEFYLS